MQQPKTYSFDNAVIYYYDKNHRTIRFDFENGKVVPPYYKKNNEWIKGIDGYWIPFLPLSFTKGIFLCVEGEKNVKYLSEYGITSFTIASHCWEIDGLTKALLYLQSLSQFEGILYVADNDNTGRIKAKKFSSAAIKNNIPHQIVNIIDIWYKVLDTICPKSSDLVDLLTISDFNLENLLCTMIIKQ